MERGQIVVLGTVVIPPENTPQKKRTETLTAKPRWKYVGPADTISFSWQIGRWGAAGFAGDTGIQYLTVSQPASATLQEFTISLPVISLSPLAVRDEPYDAEIWFKDKFADLRVIVENCVKIVAVPLGYTLTTLVSPAGAGSVTKEPDKPTYLDEIVKVTAYAAAGYVFSYWDLDGEFMGYSNPTNIGILTTPKTLTAHFVETVAPPPPTPPPPTVGYRINISINPANSGYVVKSPDKDYYSYGEMVTLTAYPYPGYYFSNWLWNGETGFGSTLYNLVMISDRNVVAYFG